MFEIKHESREHPFTLKFDGREKKKADAVMAVIILLIMNISFYVGE